MTSPRRFRLAVALLAMTAGLAALPSALPAQAGGKNETGLPMYPALRNGSQYPPSQTKSGRFLIYTAETRDALDVVEAWYRRALPKAKETKSDDGLTHGIVLTNGRDRVLVYQLGKSKGAVVELQKFVGG